MKETQTIKNYVQNTLSTCQHEIHIS